VEPNSGKNGTLTVFAVPHLLALASIESMGRLGGQLSVTSNGSDTFRFSVRRVTYKRGIKAGRSHARESVPSSRKPGPQQEICAEAETGGGGRFAPEATIILLDIIMPGISGLEAASRISSSCGSSKILIFTMHDSGELANDARRRGSRLGDRR
jgi:CheY-like chemotaxis protein